MLKILLFTLWLITNINADDDFKDPDSAMVYLRTLPIALKDIPSGIQHQEIGYPFYEKLAEAFFQSIRLTIFKDEMESYDRCYKRDGYAVMSRWDYELFVWRGLEQVADPQWIDAQKMAIACIPKIIKAMKKIGR